MTTGDPSLEAVYGQRRSSAFLFPFQRASISSSSSSSGASRGSLNGGAPAFPMNMVMMPMGAPMAMPMPMNGANATANPNSGPVFFMPGTSLPQPPNLMPLPMGWHPMQPAGQPAPNMPSKQVTTSVSERFPESVPVTPTASNDDSGDDENSNQPKRANHNALERRRRQQQRDQLQALRKVLPSLKNDPRAAAVTIIQHARQVIEGMLKNPNATNAALAATNGNSNGNNAAMERERQQLVTECQHWHHRCLELQQQLLMMQNNMEFLQNQLKTTFDELEQVKIESAKSSNVPVSEEMHQWKKRRSLADREYEAARQMWYAGRRDSGWFVMDQNHTIVRPLASVQEEDVRQQTSLDVVCQRCQMPIVVVEDELSDTKSCSACHALFHRKCVEDSDENVFICECQNKKA